MKRLILRFTVAIITFGFGFAVDRVLISPKHQPRQAQKAEPVIPQIPACPAATPLPLPAATPTPNLTFDYDQRKFDPDGQYFLLGSPPKEFREFSSFGIWAAGVQSGSVFVEVYVNNMYDAQYATFALVTQRRLFFVTSSPSEDAIEFRFDGEFLPGNPALLADKNKPVLRGTLTKTKNGRKIVERVVSFRLEFVGC